MTDKPTTGLAGFMQPELRKPEAPAAKPAKPAKAYTALTVRITSNNYERIGHFLVSNRKEFSSFQALAMEGINRIFQERGLKPLK